MRKQVCVRTFFSLSTGQACDGLSVGIFVKDYFRTIMLTFREARALCELWRHSQCPSLTLAQMSLVFGRFFLGWGRVGL